MKKMLILNLVVFGVCFFSFSQNSVYYAAQTKHYPYGVIGVADYNNDGNDDIMVSFNKTYLLVSNPDSLYDPIEVYSQSGTNYYGYAYDLNIDGKPDFYASNDNGFFYILHGDGFGVDFEPAQVVVDTLNNVKGVNAADFNRDNLIDFVITANNEVIVYRNIGDMNFVEELRMSGAHFEVKTFDFNGDNYPEIITSYPFVYYANNGGFDFTPQIIDAGIEGEYLEIGDLNNDEKPDVVISDHFNNLLVWYAFDGNGFSARQVIDNDFQDLEGIELFDIDDDNDLDILAADFLAHKIYWYENDGNGNFQRHYFSYFAYPIFIKVFWGYKLFITGAVDGLAFVPLDYFYTNKACETDWGFFQLDKGAYDYQWQIQQADEFVDLQDDDLHSGTSNFKLIVIADSATDGEVYRCRYVNFINSQVAPKYDTLYTYPVQMQTLYRPKVLAIYGEQTPVLHSEETYTADVVGNGNLLYSWNTYYGTIVEDNNTNEVVIRWDELGDDIVSLRVYDGTCISFEKVLPITVVETSLVNSTSEMKIYPNPAKDILYVENNDGNLVEILDNFGKKIISSNSSEINISQLPSGIYFVKINDDKNPKFYKFVKE